MIDVLVRIHNEAEWLPQLLKSLLRQKGVIINKVLLIDDKSEDQPEIIVEHFQKLNLKILKYEGQYLPGKMLNYGIQNLFSERNLSKYVLIISAHCYLKNTSDLKHLVNAISQNKKCRSVYGRQVPMTISDAQSFRDLTLLYPLESRLITQAASFNNAFSLISYKALADNIFDGDTTNLEDVIWAQGELNRGYTICYCAEAEVVHHHGPHHTNEEERLQKTKQTIQNYEEVFYSSAVEPLIEDDDISILFVMNKDEVNRSYIVDLIKKFTVENKKEVIIWTDVNENELLVTKNIKLINRKRVCSDETITLYERFPQIQKDLLDNGIFSEYILMFDGSYNPKYEHVDLSVCINAIRKKFPPVIWPVIKNKNLFFWEDKKGNFTANLSAGKVISEKLVNYEVLRGNGTLIGFKYLKHNTEIFNKFEFIFLEQIK